MNTNFEAFLNGDQKYKELFTNCKNNLIDSKKVFDKIDTLEGKVILHTKINQGLEKQNKTVSEEYKAYYIDEAESQLKTHDETFQSMITTLECYLTRFLEHPSVKPDDVLPFAFDADDDDSVNDSIYRMCQQTMSDVLTVIKRIRKQEEPLSSTSVTVCDFSNAVRLANQRITFLENAQDHIDDRQFPGNERSILLQRTFFGGSTAGNDMSLRVQVPVMS